jgi:hypothetical protein
VVCSVVKLGDRLARNWGCGLILVMALTGCANAPTSPPLVGAKKQAVEDLRKIELDSNHALVEILWEGRGSVVCVNDLEIGRVGSGRIVALVPLGRLYVTSPKHWPSDCREKSLLYPDQDSGNVSAYYFDVNQSGHWIWSVKGRNVAVKPQWSESGRIRLIDDNSIGNYGGQRFGRVQDFPVVGTYIHPSISVGSLRSRSGAEAIEESNSIDLDKAKQLCGEIGLTNGTEEFGNCVIELLK